jgi:hypothetical protein
VPLKSLNKSAESADIAGVLAVVLNTIAAITVLGFAIALIAVISASRTHRCDD